MTEASKPNVASQFTPIFDDIVQEYDLLAAAVYGYIWRKCQMGRGVCDAAQGTIANDLGVSKRTVIYRIEVLMKANLIIDTTPDLEGKPHSYVVQEMQTSNARDAQVSNQPMQEMHSTYARDAHQPMQEVHTGMQEMHNTYARDAHKDTKDTNRDKKGDKDTNPPTPRNSYADLVWNGILGFLENDETAARHVIKAQAAFSEITGIKQPYLNGRDRDYRQAERNWWDPLKRMMGECDNDMDTFKACITQVMAIADAPGGFTVASPKSAVKTFSGVLAKKSRTVEQVEEIRIGGAY